VDTLEKLGQGSYGVVHRGVWQGANVAVKYLVSSSTQQLQISTTEALLSKLLAHPNVVQTFACKVVELSLEYFVAASSRSGGGGRSGGSAGRALATPCACPACCAAAAAAGTGSGGGGGGGGGTPVPARPAAGHALASSPDKTCGSVPLGEPHHYHPPLPHSHHHSPHHPHHQHGRHPMPAVSGGGLGAVGVAGGYRGPRASGAGAQPSGGSSVCGGGGGGASSSFKTAAVVALQSDAQLCNSGDVVMLVPPGTADITLDMDGPPDDAAAYEGDQRHGHGSPHNHPYGSSPTASAALSHHQQQYGRCSYGTQAAHGGGGGAEQAARSSGGVVVTARALEGSGALGVPPSAVASLAGDCGGGGGGGDRSARGRSPLGEQRQRHSASLVAEGAEEERLVVDPAFLESFQSGDGFGAPYLGGEEQCATRASRHALSRSVVGGGEYCDRGSLQRAIDKSIFRASARWNSRVALRAMLRTAREIAQRVALRAMLRTAREIAQGMCHLHASQIVHGDLKPANVLLKSSRADRRGFIAKVADFGLSKIVQVETPERSSLECDTDTT
ncbi:Dual specificity protein kinase shkB, partial [Tetrabaena socialis]